MCTFIVWIVKFSSDSPPDQKPKALLKPLSLSLLAPSRNLPNFHNLLQKWRTNECEGGVVTEESAPHPNLVRIVGKSF